MQYNYQMHRYSTMKLDLIYPCHENINNMPNTDKGKFCGQCAKEVIDFTAMSKEEVLNHLSKKKTCGIFRNDQLDQVHEPIVHIRPRKHFVRLALASLSVFMLSMVGCDAQTNDHGEKKNNGEKCNKEAKSKGQTHTMGKPANPEILMGDTIDIGEIAPIDTIQKIDESIRGEVIVEPIPPQDITAGVPIALPPKKMEVFGMVEQQPEFPGGESALIKYLNTNIRYPRKEQRKKIEGRVILDFQINEDGMVSDIQVKRSVSKNIDKEAIRVIENMPKWKVGIQNGEAVPVRFTLPIEFSLD